VVKKYASGMSGLMAELASRQRKLRGEEENEEESSAPPPPKRVVGRLFGGGKPSKESLGVRGMTGLMAELTSRQRHIRGEDEDEAAEATPPPPPKKRASVVNRLFGGQVNPGKTAFSGLGGMAGMMAELTARRQQDAGSDELEAPPGLAALKDDPTYEKYFKMIRMHIPRPAVEIKMRAEDLDPIVLDQDPNRPLHWAKWHASSRPKSQQPSVAESLQLLPPGSVALKDDPTYEKYFKMIRMHILRPAVEIKMREEDLDLSVLDQDPNMPLNWPIDEPNFFLESTGIERNQDMFSEMGMVSAEDFVWFASTSPDHGKRQMNILLLVDTTIEGASPSHARQE
jgi:hypothetical protein